MTNLTVISPDRSGGNEAVDAFGRLVARRLASGEGVVSKQHLERLLAARAQALAARKLPASLPTPHREWRVPEWLDLGPRALKIASAAPLFALVAGLWIIDHVQSEALANETAEIELNLLTGKLPLAAYTDPGFTEFLKRKVPPRMDMGDHA